MPFDARLLYNHPLVIVARSVAAQVGCPIYLVGGALRDMLLGASHIKDLDFVVGDCLDAAVSGFAERVRGRIIPWDFGQRRIVFRQASAPASVDFSRCRGTGIVDDLKERDFTINAMAVDVCSLQPGAEALIIDPVNGRLDLKKGVLRACSPQAIDQDPLRALRAARLAGEFGLSIEPFTRQLICQKAGLLCEVARERSKRELFIALGLEGVCAALHELLMSGLLERLIPELQEFRAVAQGYPHECNLFDHSLQTVWALDEMLLHMPHTIADYRSSLSTRLREPVEEGVSRRSLLIFTGLLHDSGKPATKTEKAGRICFHGHESESARLNRLIAVRLGLGRRAQTMIESMSINHMRLLQLAQLDAITKRAKARVLRDMGDAAPETILLAMADCRATSAAPEYEEVIRQTDIMAAELLADCFGQNEILQEQPQVNGKEVMEILGIAEGPCVGAVLKKIHELERSGRLPGKDDALQWLRKKKASGLELE